MRFLIFLILFFSSSESCRTSTPKKVSLRSIINLALDQSEHKQPTVHPARNILQAANRTCVNEKLKSNNPDPEVTPSQAAFTLTTVSFLCCPQQHFERIFDYYAKNTISTGLSIECVEEKISNFKQFYLIKKINPSKTAAQCESELSSDDRMIVKNTNAMRKESNFEGCADEFYALATIEDYLMKYLEMKPASDDEITRTKVEYINYYRDVTQRTIDCIREKLNQ